MQSFGLKAFDACRRSAKTVLIAATITTGTFVAGCGETSGSEAGFTDEQTVEIKTIVREYLLENPQILQEMITALEVQNQEEQARQAAAAISENRDQLINPGAAFVAGNPEGDVTLVEFFDYMCTFCRAALPDLNRLLEEDPNLRLVYIDYPVLADRSVASLVASSASIAAAKQGKYVELHQRLMGHEDQLQEQDVLKIAQDIGLDMEQLVEDMNADPTIVRIEANMELAEKLGITGTPSFVLGDKVIEGAVGYDALLAAITAARASQSTDD